MELRNVLFKIGEYDRDGDLMSEGIYLSFGDTTTVRIADNLKGFKEFIKHLESMVDEIEECYPEACCD